MQGGVLRLGGVEGEQGAGVSLADTAFHERFLHRLGQLEQPQRVGYGHTVLTDAVCYLIVRKTKLIYQVPVRLGRFQGAQIGALDVLYQG